MSKPIISIIGLGVTGSSIGLSLRREEGNFDVVGHDKDRRASDLASKAEAVNRTSWNLHKAYADAELVVLAVPLSELPDLLELIRDDLAPNALVVAVAKLMQPVLGLSTDLPHGAQLVAIHPILTGVGGMLAPRADLFDDTPICISTDINTDPSSLKLASDFAERIGGTPLFIDALEHDGIVAGVEQLPQLLAAAQVQTAITAPSWSETERIAGRQFAQSTELGGSAESLFDAFMGNRENLLLRIDQLQNSLSNWREMLEIEQNSAQDEDEGYPLLDVLKEVVQAREEWEIRAELKRWDADESRDEYVSSAGMMQQMFFGNLFKKRVEKRDGDR